MKSKQLKKEWEKKLEVKLLQLFENSPHKVIHDPEIAGGTMFVLSADYKLLVESAIHFISLAFDALIKASYAQGRKDGYEEGYIKGDNGKHKIGMCGAAIFVTRQGDVCAECGKVVPEDHKKK